jgi:hypothetical protein
VPVSRVGGSAGADGVSDKRQVVRARGMPQRNRGRIEINLVRKVVPGVRVPVESLLAGAACVPCELVAGARAILQLGEVAFTVFPICQPLTSQGGRGKCKLTRSTLGARKWNPASW